MFNDSTDKGIISFLSEKLVGKIFKLNLKVTSFNFKSTSAGLTVLAITGDPINIKKVLLLLIFSSKM